VDESEKPALTRYRAPPDDVVRILDAPPTPWVLPSPDGRWLLYVEHPAMPRLADLARPMLRLAGLRIDPAASARHQVSFGSGLVLHSVDEAVESEGANDIGRRIALPSGRRISSVSWSHSSDRFACTLIGESGTELWCADTTESCLRRIAPGIHAVFGSGFEWMPDGKRILCSLVPLARRSAPEDTGVAIGPSIQETYGDRSPLRTFQDLLGSPHDEALFAHHATSELAIADSASADSASADSESADSESADLRRFGEPCIFSSVDVAPGGELVLVTRVKEPFSYLHSVHGFPHSIEVWSSSGERVHVVADVPMAENIPIEGVRLGPRGVSWCPHEDATLVWVEALDGGDPRRTVPHRDRWLELSHPFRGEPREILRLEHRATHFSWMPDPSRVLVREYDRDRRWTRAAIGVRGDAKAPPIVIDDRSTNDRYRDPGAVLTRPTERGRRVVRQEGSWIFRAGEGETEHGSRPFLDRHDLETLAIERVWRSEENEYESYFAFVEGDERRARAFLSRHESPRDPPNLRLREFSASSFRAVTRFPDPTPDLRGIRKELIHYRREDGVALSGTLYLPADHSRGTRLPLVLWAYPQDFVDADTAGQVRETPSTFTRIGGVSHLFFLMRGYAVLDGASMPIIGDPATMNDTFIDQSVASARAAIARVAELGVGDPERVGIGGHSYGAFMAANLLAHSALFRAGIARSGAYNRTLTPFGFQAERRSLWEAPESYAALSPLGHADKIRAPLLLIHGAEDDNPGTFPLQSERLFHAIKGNGGTARYVVLPHESHAYRARESVLHVLHEMFAWFDRFVKAPGSRRDGSA
jgi:dipeptidyl aminopeptidase/acylaminoacyl peptidase